ncbi:hypothetical protein [Halostagnicola sp. A-GB9-2]|uniref:hypothetical protein n=1 Tax=Halostagnicola sp. A-GB9-2 TaxID=3048066 RepID=UPI0024BFBD05|nr:hypothetical protein [Halostagnicola sp. A-GB9-2]MDJ1431266.1 hypothetical protein [Halostagnicola sp. A-GB9-2]
MSTAFQTAVRKNVQRENRYEAIDRLVEKGERTNLSIIVQMGGLDGEFRRRALEGLSNCRATEELEELAEDTTVAPSLRRRADELVS